MISSKNLQIRIPESAVAEFAMVEEMDWTDGIPLEDLLGWINQVVARFRPDAIDEKARSSQEFTARTFRHYQTLGCIDAPVRQGKRVHYGFRHYLQGLLLRKLLWERIPSEQIVELMAGRSNEDYKQLLFEGIEIVPRGGTQETGGGNHPKPSPQLWTRVDLAPGVELNLQHNRPRLSGKDVDRVLAELKRHLQANA